MSTTGLSPRDPRVASPIFTPRQIAELANMPITTVYSWTHPTAGRPALIHRLEPDRRGWPSIPLIGAAEAMVLRPLRESRMPMREIAAAVAYLRETGGDYALANPDLLHDGVISLHRDVENNLIRLRDGQGILPGVLTDQLTPFRLAPDGFVEALLLNEIPDTEIDPRFSAGRPFFTKTGVPVFAVKGLLDAGEPPDVVAREYGIELRLVTAVQNADPRWLSQVA